MCRALNPDTMGSLCSSLLLSSLDLIMSHITLSNDIGKLLLQSCHVVLGRKLQECNLLLQSILVLYQAGTASEVKSAGLGPCQHLQVGYVQPPNIPRCKSVIPRCQTLSYRVSIHIWRLAQDAGIMSLADSMTPYAMISNQARLANLWCCRDCDAPTGMHVKPKHSTCISQLYMSKCKDSGG